MNDGTAYDGEVTSEIPHLFGTDRISDSAVSSLADNVVMLSYQREHDTISRRMTVIKTRASRNDPTVRKFVIGPQGIVLEPGRGARRGTCPERRHPLGDDRVQSPALADWCPDR
jgi:hypothetical protein